MFITLPMAAGLPMAASVLLAVAITSGCAGYRVGSHTLYPNDIRTVHVPVFESESIRPELGQWLTEAVVKQIEQTTPYKVVNREQADTVLQGVLLADTKRVSVTTDRADPREVDVGFRVSVRWIDNRGQLVHPEAVMPVPEALTNIARASSQVTEVGHSTVSAQQDVIERMAEQIVAIMEAPW